MDKFFIGVFCAVRYGMHNSTAHPEYFNPFGVERSGGFLQGYYDDWMTVEWCKKVGIIVYRSAQTIN